MAKVYKNLFEKCKDKKVKTSKGSNMKEKYLGVRTHDMTVVFKLVPWIQWSAFPGSIKIAKLFL